MKNSELKAADVHKMGSCLDKFSEKGRLINPKIPKNRKQLNELLQAAYEQGKMSGYQDGRNYGYELGSKDADARHKSSATIQREEAKLRILNSAGQTLQAISQIISSENGHL